jgi:PqqD family protein of HPr-rel-A system
VTAPIRPKARDDLEVVEIDGEAVVYDERTGNLHHLNPTAALVLAVCDGTATIRELAGDLAAEFGEPPDRLERDVRTLLRRFRLGGLLDGEGGESRG